MAVDLNNAFLLEFAGVPFVPDYARRVRTHQETPEHSPASQLPAERFQPNPDLIEEIDRMIPMRYLQDFQEPGDDYPGRNLGAIALRSPSSNSPGTDLRIYDWYYPPTASRWSVFRGLMTSSMVKTVNGATRGGALPATFTMKNVPLSPFNSQPSNYTVSTQMFVLPPRPIGEDGSVGSLDGLYLVTLVDERYFAQGTPATVRVDQNTTWDDLIAQLANELGIVLTYSAIPINYSRPSSDSQLWCNQETASLLLDAVAYNIGRTVVRNLDGSYVLLNPAESQTRSNNNRGNSSKVVRMAGGDIFSSGTRIPAGNLTDFRNSVVPANVNVTFPKYIQGNDPVPHFVNPRTTPQRPSVWYEESYGDVYNVSVPISSGGSNVSGLIGVSEYTIQTTAKALYSGEILAASGMIPVNESGLTALAMQLTRNYYAAQTLVALDEVYPGIINWLPEGFHDIIWTYSVKEGRACTRVMRTEWNASIRSMQQASPAISGQTNVPVGVGGPSLALTVRDSDISGFVPISLSSPLLSGQQFAQLQSLSGAVFSGAVPFDHRWRGKVDNEWMLFEGASGESVVDIVYRGIDGTLVDNHLTGTFVSGQIPKTTYGNNLLTFQKDFDVYQGAWTSGGISETIVRIKPSLLPPLSNAGSVVHVTRLDLTDDGYQPGFLCVADGTDWNDKTAIWIKETDGAHLGLGHYIAVSTGDVTQGGETLPSYQTTTDEFPAQITSTGGPPYQWEEQVFTTGGFGPKPNGRSGSDAEERNMNLKVPQGAYVWMRRAESESDQFRFDYESGDAVTIININDINNITNYYNQNVTNNTFFFNTFDNILYLYIDGRFIGFCPCIPGSGSGSGSGVGPNPCCLNITIPSTLHLTLSNATGTCGCVGGQVIALVGGFVGGWSYTAPLCPADPLTGTNVNVNCVNGTWILIMRTVAANGCIASKTVPLGSYSCSPLYVPFIGIAINGCCLGTVDGYLTI